MEWWFFALFVPFLGGFAGGALSTLLIRWTLHRAALDLDYRLSDLEGRVNREVKIRAGVQTANKKKFEEEILEKISQESKAQNQTGVGPSPNLASWIQSKYRKG